MKILEKKKAIELRKQGWSLAELSKELGVSKATVSVWVRNIKLSKKAEEILDAKFTKGQLASQVAHKKITAQKMACAQEFAKNTLKNFRQNKSFNILLCSMIYLCEGAKSDYGPMIFMNSDPELLKTFLTLLRSSFNLDEKKFRVHLHLHDYHNTEEQLSFWSKSLTIPRYQFSKPYRKPSNGKYKKEGYQGCASVRYYDVDIARKLNALAKAFTKKGP